MISTKKNEDVSGLFKPCGFVYLSCSLLCQRNTRFTGFAGQTAKWKTCIYRYCFSEFIEYDRRYDMHNMIWYPFECDMGLDGTLTSHIERVADEFDMACQSAI